MEICTSELKASTIEALRKIKAEKPETLEYMMRFGGPLEKAIASVIFECGA